MRTQLRFDKVFMTYQQRLLSSVSHHAVVVVEKSRRTGYSWAAAAIAVLEASAETGQDVYYIGYNLEMAREFITYCGEWAKKINGVSAEVSEYVFSDPDNPDKDIKAFRIELASGHKIVALPSVARALRGMQGFVIIDEAAFHDDLTELLKAAFALLIWGGKVVIISTHDGDENPFNELINDIRGGRKPYHLERCTFDDALKDGLFKRVCAQSDKEWSPQAEEEWKQGIVDFYGEAAEEELFCIPSKSGGKYLPRVLVEGCADSSVPVVRLALPDSFSELPSHIREAETKEWCEENLDELLKSLNPKLKSFFGEDFGRRGDLSIFWIGQEERDMSLRTPFVVELRNVPFEQQKQILFYMVDRLPRFCAGALDAGGNGAYLAEVARQRYGSGIIEEISFSREWYRENMPRLKAYLEDKTLSIPKDSDIFGDFSAIKMQGGIAKPDEKRTSDEKGQRHGDAAIAAALLVYASRMDIIEYGYQAPADLNSEIGNHPDDDNYQQKWSKGAW